MEDLENAPEAARAAPAPNSEGWQRRLAITVVGALLIAALIALAVALPTLVSPPHLVYPPTVQATIEAQVETLRVNTSGQRPVNNELLEELMKQYGLKDCQVGGKYGALCRDGTFERTGLLRDDQLHDICEPHGGVEEWIECRWP